MKVFKVDLYEYFGVKKPEGARADLTCFVNENSREICLKRRYPCMLVLPGGGYAMCSDREAEPIAAAYYAQGYNTYVLRYTNYPLGYPHQLKEAAMAMAYIRREAEAQMSNPDAVAAIGFSAGGHLCGCLATMFDDEAALSADITNKELRPNAVVLSYAVLSEALSDGQTFRCLCEKCPESRKNLDIPSRVTANTSPSFIWHTRDDNCVAVEHSLNYAMALSKNNVPFSLHVFAHGQHGLSLADDRVYGNVTPGSSAFAGKWFDLSVSWLKEQGFTVKDEI